MVITILAHLCCPPAAPLSIFQPLQQLSRASPAGQQRPGFGSSYQVGWSAANPGLHQTSSTPGVLSDTVGLLLSGQDTKGENSHIFSYFMKMRYKQVLYRSNQTELETNRLLSSEGYCCNRHTHTPTHKQKAWKRKKTCHNQ